MADAPENLVLEHLKRIQATLDGMKFDILDLKVRASATEQHLAQLSMQYAGLSSRMDRFDERLSRIERRLDLIEA